MLEVYESIFGYRQKWYIEKHGYSGTGNLAVRRDVFERMGPFGGINIAEDTEWGRRAEKLGLSTRYCPEMIVFHSARKTFAQLYAKWERHIAHSFHEYSKRRFWRVIWALYAVGVAISGIVDVFRYVLTSPRIANWRQRAVAAFALVRVRAYRSRRMLHMLVKGDKAQSSQSWNRH